MDNYIDMVKPITAKTKKEKCRKTFCKRYTKKQYKLFKEVVNSFKTVSKEKQRTKKIYAELKKKLPKECMELYCNEGCVNTIFQDGKTKMPHLAKDRKFLEKLLKQQKKEIFGDKDTVLRDHFYEKLSKKSQNKLKSFGAISGCVEAV